MSVLRVTVFRTGNSVVDRNLQSIKRFCDQLGDSVTALTTSSEDGLADLSGTLSGTVASLRDAADFNSFANAGTGGAGETWTLAATVGNGGAALANINTVTADTLYAFPFVAPRRGGTVDKLSFEQTGVPAAGFRARIGIYANSVSESVLYPGALAVDGGELTPLPAGVKTATVSAPLRAGALYWAVLVHNGNGASTNLTGVRATLTACCPALLGITPSMGNANVRTGITVAFTYAALPATFPSGGAYVTSAPIALAMRIS